MLLALIFSTDAAGVVDLSGQERDPFREAEGKALVLVFISIECPISNRYAPEIQRLEKEFAGKGIKFWLVQPDRSESVEKTRAYLKEFGYRFELLRDNDQALVRKAKAKVTPEAAVFDREGKLVYCGRIDDRYVDYGKMRPAPTRRELQTVLEELVADRLITVTNTPAIGCFIPK